MLRSARRQTFLVVIVLLGLTLLFFRQVVFSGMVFVSADAQAAASAGAPLRAALAAGEYPLWTPYLFGGMPSYASLLAAPLIGPGSWLNGLLNLPFAAPRRWDLVAHFLLAGLGVFAYLRGRGIAAGPALLAGLAFEFSVHHVGMVAFGHNTKLMTIAYLPWALWATERLLARPGPGRLALLATIVGLQLLSAHVQMAYYTWLALGLYAGCWLLWRNPLPVAARIARTGWWLGGLGLGLALSAVLYVPVLHYTGYSVRGGLGGLPTEQAGGWSLPPWELLTFVLPGLFGGGGELYWGGLTFADFPHYVGVVTAALAAIALARGARFGNVFHVPGTLEDAWHVEGHLARADVHAAADATANEKGHCEERSDEAVSDLHGRRRLLRCARNDLRKAIFRADAHTAAVATADENLTQRHKGTKMNNFLGVFVALCEAGAGIFRADRRTGGCDPGRQAAEGPVAPLVPFLVLLALVAAALASGEYGGPLFAAQRALLPLYNKFRAPVQALVLAEFALAALAGVGLHRLLTATTFPRGLLIAAAAALAAAISATAGHAPLLALAQALHPATPPALSAARLQLAARDLWFAAFLLAGAALATWQLVTRRLSAWAGTALLIALVVVDLWRIDAPLAAAQPAAALQPADGVGELAAFMRTEGDLFRVLPLGPFFGDNRWAGYGVASVGGYHAVKLRLYQAFLDGLGLPQRADPLALALLNVRWVLAPGRLDAPHLEPVGWTTLLYAGQPTNLVIYRNRNPHPRAWLVPAYRLAADDATAWAILRSPDFDPAQTAVLAQPPAFEPAPGAAGRVEVTGYGLHEIRLRAAADTPRLLVLSEVYYPAGWRATVDGAAAAILRADVALRAVALPAGEHEVVLRFAPWDVAVGLAISLAAALVLIALGCYAVYCARRPA